MSEPTLQQTLKDLSAAEEFLDYFGIAYDAAVVQVNRLHILQRFHDYLEGEGDAMPADVAAQTERCRELLARAYTDFVTSNAAAERVFKVFHKDEPTTVFVPVDRIFR